MLDLKKLPLLRKLPENDTTPHYVQIYDIIYKYITGDSAVPGEPLPSENAMAAYWHVSRGTIRTALKRLAEDGYINRTQGKASTISEFIHDVDGYANWIQNICIAHAIVQVTHILMRSGPQLSIGMISEKLGVPQGSPLDGVDLGYYHNSEKIAHTFITTPSLLLDMQGIRRDDRKAVRLFYTDTIYQLAKRARAEMSVSGTDYEPSLKLKGDNDPVICVEGVLYAAPFSVLVKAGRLDVEIRHAGLFSRLAIPKIMNEFL